MDANVSASPEKTNVYMIFFVGLTQSFMNSYDIQPHRIPWFFTLVPCSFLDMPVARLPI